MQIIEKLDDYTLYKFIDPENCVFFGFNVHFLVYEDTNLLTFKLYYKNESKMELTNVSVDELLSSIAFH